MERTFVDDRLRNIPAASRCNTTKMGPPSEANEHIFPPWQLDRWKAVDDRIRGGSSTSHLDQAEGSSSAVRFWGHLDIDTLGGAGFASQRFLFAPEPLHLPRHKYKGIVLHLPTSSTTAQSKVDTFTLVLKTSPSQQADPPNLPPRPQPANLSYEANFSPSRSRKWRPFKTSKTDTVHLKLNDFEPTYRGRKVERSDPRYQPLHSEKIYEISLMCRSGFGKQHGDFELIIGDISKWEKESRVTWLVGLIIGFWDMFLTLWSRWTGSTGKIQLGDEEKDKLPG